MAAALSLGATLAGASEPARESHRQTVEQALRRLTATDGVHVRRSKRTGLPRFIAARRGPGFATSAAEGATPEQRAHAFIAEHGAAFGLGQTPDTKVLRVTPRDKAGLEHVRVQQMYRGIPVTGGEMIVHMDGDNVRVANGHVLDAMDIGELDVSPTLNEARAGDIAAGVVREAYGAAEPRLAAPRLEVFNRGLLDNSDAPSRLAWFVEVRAPRVREYVWVDAQDGSVLLHFNQMPHALNRTIYDATSSYPGVVVRTEGAPATGDTDVDLLYAYLGSAYNYFKSEHRRNSYDGADAPIVGVAHIPFDNAWWADDVMRFEFGNNLAQADDIVAHEFAHAVDQYTAGLYYSFEPGALNEAFSDIFGETVDLLNGLGNDVPEVRWSFGEDDPVRGAGRNLMDPNLFGNPGRVSDPLFRCEFDDGYGVHYNSGVPSHAYALMVDGGTYNGRTVRGIGLDKAGHIAYRALTYLTSASGFEEASDAFQQACTDMVGQEGIAAADCAEVQKALQAVEMTDSRPCHSVFVEFKKAGAGSGTMWLSRYDLDKLHCEPASTCDAYFAEGPSIRVMAVEDAGSVFAGWRGVCSTATTFQCEPFLMGDRTEVVAVFEPAGTTHPLTVTISGSTTGAAITSTPAGISCMSGGSGCTAVFNAGQVVTLTSTAAPGSVLTRWGGACSGVAQTCVLTMSGPLSVTAEFGPVPFYVERSLGGGSGYGGGAWGDYDGDGDLDIVVVDKGRSVVYRNDGGSFVDIGAPLFVFDEYMAAAWGDYDNDGDLDLAVAGEDAANHAVAKLYRNDAGSFVDSGMVAPGLGPTSSLTWVDYDNDGDLDLVAPGITNTGGSPQAWILRNDHGTLVDSGLSLATARDMQWGDYDADGDLDLMVAGISAGTPNPTSTLYRNESGALVDSGMELKADGAMRAAWGDYDNDGHIDLALINYGAPMLYRNQGGRLVEAGADLRGDGWDIAWGDADADGDLDLLHAGVLRAPGSSSTVRDTVLLDNRMAAGFAAVASGLPVANGVPAVWGDYDNDGRLDLYLHSSGEVYRSYYGATNTPPQPPASTRVVLSADGVRLVWTAGSDAQTPAAGLSYNVRVGTTAFGSEIVSAMSDALTGRRFVVAAGNAGSNLFYVLKGLAPGHYYYTVQSIDTSFAGSGFTSGTFDYPPAVSASIQITSDTGTGYCADITVTNISSSTVNGWQTGFALPGGSAATITSLTNFQYTRDGAVVTLQPRWFNRTLTAGQRVAGRVCANGSTGARYELEVSKNGTGSGYVSANPVGIECGSDCSESYPGGTAVTLSATPAAGSRFLRWDGACTGSASTCTVTMGPGVAPVTAWFMRDTTGGVTVTPVVADHQLYYNNEQVRIDNPTALTALSITIVIQRTTGITFNGQYNTVGSQIQQSHTTGASTITYRFTLAAGQTVSAGSGWTFAAQTNGTGTAHPTSGDTYSVTYTTGGQAYTQTGTF